MREEDIRNRDAFDQYLKILQSDTEKIFDKSTFVKVNCPSCGSEFINAEFIKMGFNYSECSKCKTLYVNPRPRISDLEEFYSNSQSTEFWVHKFFMPVSEARREKIFAPRARQIANEFSQLAQGKIGDIGAGFGLFLEELGKIWANSNLIAIEPSEEMIKICKEKNLKVIPKMLENMDSDIEGSFDLLTSFELFEHLYNPKEFLHQVRRLLKKDGYFVMTTLNGCGFDIQMLWEKSKSFSPPQHLNFFNPQCIKSLFEECGFVIEKVVTPGKLDWDIVESMYKNDGVELDRFWTGILTSEPSVKENLQKWITESGLSSHMQVVARKGTVSID